MPNTNARQLKIQQSRSLVFVVKGTRNLFFSDFLVQLQRAATLYGYNGIVSYWTKTPTRSMPPKRSCGDQAQRYDLSGRQRSQLPERLCQHHSPSVLTTLVSDELDFPNLSMVGVDDRAAAYTAVDYLIQQGIARSQCWAVRSPVIPA